jgi:hypothetical protein
VSALLLFAFVDGLAAYGRNQKWDWNDPALCRRGQLLFASAGFTACVLLILASASIRPTPFS